MRKLTVGVLVAGALLAAGPGLFSQGTRVRLFDGAIHGVTDKTPGEPIFTDGDYADFRLILKSRLVSEARRSWNTRTSKSKWYRTS